MANKKILVYQTKEVFQPQVEEIKKNQRWSLSMTSLVPTGKPKKYFIYSIFSFLRIFKNKEYCSYYTLDSKRNVASSLLVIPAYYRWPFMQSSSVQFTYVITAKDYRGKGLAWQGIYQAYRDLKEKGIVNYWYVTDSENTASQRLAEKMGFKLAGYAKKKIMLFGIIKILKLHEAK
jgi:RimJ/RimL family protein N-acetyltransferase